ncbi:MAG TPA: hypothetical protein VKB76_11880, partial [Ktedonobacterales bacterium]|nr:hypothetical protein [Ktedonobacterales bacterium]
MNVIRAPQQGPPPGAAPPAADPTTTQNGDVAKTATSPFLALLALLGTPDADAVADSAMPAMSDSLTAKTTNDGPAISSRPSSKTASTPSFSGPVRRRTGNDSADQPALPFGVPIIISQLPAPDTRISQSRSDASPVS